MSPHQLEKCSTGVPGLDDVLGGGLPRASLYLVEGNPGVGKTTLAIQFLLDGVRTGETCLYVSLSETTAELSAVSRSHGWDLSRISIIDLSAVEKSLGAERPTTLFQSAEIELNQLSRLITEQVERIRPSRLVLDSLSEFRLLAQNPARYRREILRLKQHLAEKECTVVVLDDRASHGSEVQVHSLVHGAINLEAAPLKYGVFRRSLSVIKLRGVRFREGTHDYIIDKGGLRVFPRLVAAEHQAPFSKSVGASGNERLDLLLGGGLHFGTSNLIIGPAGSGKSTLCAMFAESACRRGERVLYYVFDETQGTLRKRAAEMSIDLDGHIGSGMLLLEQMDPAAVSPGELASRVRNSVHEKGVRMVILDSLNGYVTAMPDEAFLNLHLHEMLMYLNQQGVMTLMILAQHGLVSAMGTPIDVSYLADSVIITRYFEAGGNIRKAISIIKKRSGPHESAVRELTMDRTGIVIGEPLTEFQGVLTGVPSYLGAGRASMDVRPPAA